MRVSDICEHLTRTVKREWIDDVEFYSKILKDKSFEGAILGSNSVYNIKTRTCFVSRHVAFCQHPISPLAVSRKIIEIALKANKRKAYPRDFSADNMPLLSAPLLARPYKGELVYLDLKAAFYQIYTKMPLFLNQKREKWLLSSPWLAEFLPVDLIEYKLIRNGLVGCWRSSYTRRIKGGNVIRQRCYTPTTNYISWNFVQSVLHHLAFRAKELGAVYIHTDGYIFPSHSGFVAFQEYCKSIGFQLVVKAQGVGEIWGIGRYAIGVHATKLIGEIPPIDRVQPLDKIVITLLQLRKYNPHY